MTQQCFFTLHIHFIKGSFCEEPDTHTHKHTHMLLAIITVYGEPPGSEGPFGWNLSFSLCLIVFLISFFSSRCPPGAPVVPLSQHCHIAQERHVCYDSTEIDLKTLQKLIFDKR